MTSLCRPKSLTGLIISVYSKLEILETETQDEKNSIWLCVLFIRAYRNYACGYPITERSRQFGMGSHINVCVLAGRNHFMV